MLNLKKLCTNLVDKIHLMGLETCMQWFAANSSISFSLQNVRFKLSFAHNMCICTLIFTPRPNLFIIKADHIIGQYWNIYAFRTKVMDDLLFCFGTFSECFKDWKLPDEDAQFHLEIFLLLSFMIPFHNQIFSLVVSLSVYIHVSWMTVIIRKWSWFKVSHKILCDK